MNFRFERLEARRLLASDLGEITGVVLNDLQGDNNSANDVVVAGLPVTLFRDGNGNGQFDGAATDPQFGPSVDTNSSGEYQFTGLTEGTYFVRITPSSDLQVLDGGNLKTVTFNASEAMGVTAITIDDFSTAQTVTATRMVADAGPVDNSVADGANPNAGGVRDLYAEATSLGNVSLTSQFGGGNLLSLESSSGTEGIARVTWDGTDGDGDAVDPDNLSLDFSQGGDNFGVLLRVSADNKPGAEVTMRLTSGDGNTAEATVLIQDQDGVFDGDEDEVVTIPFTAFNENVTGSGVNFSNVTAIELELDFRDPSINGLDARLELVGIAGNTVKEADFTVLNRMSLGDQVFADMDNDGVFEVGESGIANVVVSLYEDSDSSGNYTNGVDEFLENDVTDSNGNYLFDDLLPGDYLVRIAATEFGTGEPLAGMASSTGNESGGVAPDPDNDVDNDDNGYLLSTTLGVVTRAITLVGQDEPTNDSESDNNTNLTLDLGFYGFDLVIDKDVDLSTVVPGGELTYTIVVTNNGPSTATGVFFTDNLPGNVDFASGSTNVGSGTVSHSSGTVTANLGDIAPGGMATVTINVDVDNDATGTLTNTASVSAPNESDTNNNSSSAVTTIDDLVDLEIIKRDDDGNAAIDPGSTLIYTLEVTNNGPAPATGVVVTDTLPDNVTFNPAGSTTPSTNTGGVLTYNLGTLDPRESTEITIVVVVDSEFVGTLTNTANVVANEDESNEANNSATAESLVAVEPSSISGHVYVDSNNDGEFDANEQPIAGVTITLTGIDFTDSTVNQTTTTGANGAYLFANLLPGIYEVTETDPAFFPDGQDTIGSENGTVSNDRFSDIELASGVNATDYNFGELPPTLTKRRFLASSFHAAIAEDSA